MGDGAEPLFSATLDFAVAEAIVRASKYAPAGNRGLVDMLRYRARDQALYTRLNDETVVVVQIEGLDAVAQATDILSVLEVKGFINKPEGTNRWEIHYDKIEDFLRAVGGTAA